MVGSFKDGLRIEHPTEFDFKIILDLDRLPNGFNYKVTPF